MTDTVGILVAGLVGLIALMIDWYMNLGRIRE